MRHLGEGVGRWGGRVWRQRPPSLQEGSSRLPRQLQVVQIVLAVCCRWLLYYAGCPAAPPPAVHHALSCPALHSASTAHAQGPHGSPSTPPPPRPPPQTRPVAVPPPSSFGLTLSSGWKQGWMMPFISCTGQVRRSKGGRQQRRQRWQAAAAAEPAGASTPCAHAACTACAQATPAAWWGRSFFPLSARAPRMMQPCMAEPRPSIVEPACVHARCA